VQYLFSRNRGHTALPVAVVQQESGAVTKPPEIAVSATIAANDDLVVKLVNFANGSGMPSSVRIQLEVRNSFCHHFYTKTNDFTKTGSGQT